MNKLIRKLIPWLGILIVGGYAMTACGREGLSVKVLSRETGTLRQKFFAEVADTPEKRAMGLMYRRDLAKDQGMLFVFPYPTEGPFWMRNTLISLDMLFIGGDKKILTIVPQAEPQTTTPRVPQGPYLYVLEIRGGRSADLGIRVGDGVQFDIPLPKN